MCRRDRGRDNVDGSGYVGEDVENIILRLLQNADYDVSVRNAASCTSNEIDKITRKSGGRPARAT